VVRFLSFLPDGLVWGFKTWNPIRVLFAPRLHVERMHHMQPFFMTLLLLLLLLLWWTGELGQ